MEPSKRRRPMTAGEAIAANAANPEYQAMIAARDAKIQARASVELAASAPLLAELRDVGVDVPNVWDLVNTSTPYPEALPVLVRHLSNAEYPDRVRAGIARSLAVRDAAPWWSEFRRLFLEQHGGEAEEGLAVAIAASAAKDNYDDLVALTLDPSVSPMRSHFLRAIRRLGGTAGNELIASLVDDPVLGPQATDMTKRSRRKSS
jgi:hypothetical protein